MKIKFTHSFQYWNDRYERNGNSGPGSYGQLAKFKSDVINKFVKDFDVKSVIEFGCGDGNQLELMNYENYVGYDIAQKSILLCKEKFEKDKTKQFFHYNEYDGRVADLSLSLDVIYHLIEDEVFEKYMKTLLSSSVKYVIIYSSNAETIPLLKSANHVKHRKFLDNINEDSWKILATIKNQFPFDARDPTNTSFSDFYLFERQNNYRSIK